MTVLWVKVGGLWPPHTGGRLRTLHMISELSRRHAVVVLTTCEHGDDGESLNRYLALCNRVVAIPFTAPRRGQWRFLLSVAGALLSSLPVDLWKWRARGIRHAVARVLRSEQFDVIVSDFLVARANIPAHTALPIVYFAHNVEHVIWRRLKDVATNPIHRMLLEIEWRKMRRVESRVCSSSTLTVAVSDTDRETLRAEARGAPVVAVPTGVDTTYFAPSPSTGHKTTAIVFSGAMDWYPNEDAVWFFVERVLPLIRRDVPDASFTVVGRRPSPRLQRLASSRGVCITGTVEDVRPYLAEASVYVVPLRVGGGTRLKIFEAFAMAKPVVSTSIGAEGLEVVPGKHLEIADDPETFSKAVVGLLCDGMRRRALGCEARKLVEEKHSWDNVARVFERHLATAIAAARSPDARS